MTQAMSGVLKGSRIRQTPPKPLGPAGFPAGGGQDSGAAARIIEQAGGQAVVEIVCDCGKVIHLRCTYDAPAAPGGVNP